MPTIKTIKVKNEKAKNGFMLINECDFDETKHERLQEETINKPKKKKVTRKKKVATDE